ncbi:TonB-linked outer membrane protein, SusC/RagA family [Cesiribacter andamanensis AMV16]|uniref:TonB-linked outer membrane protein, SusC/RagA family n=2 Tax=Cesiribacter TaxID=1133570 RepID=M7P1E2_9BACT|nr:TonB-linked outer membrane protein, SusC/RagA family [Cesiribacter andamanensis AMV16]
MSFLLLGVMTSAWAQRTVTGRVTSQAEGEGLPGVAVRLKNGTGGTVTDMDGNYRIEVPSDNAILVFSFIGYTAKEEAVGTRTTINIQLSEDVEQLQEVVVTGYSASSRQALVSSVSAVGEKELKMCPCLMLTRCYRVKLLVYSLLLAVDSQELPPTFVCVV